MIATCVHVRPDGRLCRRIPKRGETLCPIHRSRRSATRDELFDRAMNAWSEHLQALPLEQLLAAALTSLDAIGPIIEHRSSRMHRAAFTRAAIAVGAAAELLESMLRRPARPQPPASAPPLRPGGPAAAELEAKRASLDRLNTLCERFGRMIPPETSRNARSL